jgi:DNA-directed RNA polymerase subunit RPC12/RpoP
MQGAELGCYNEGMRLAAEYRGPEHYWHMPLCHGDDPLGFAAQLRRDEAKRELAENARVVLLEVPCTVTHAEIRAHVRAKLETLSYDIARPIGPLSDFVATAIGTVRSAASSGHPSPLQWGPAPSSGEPRLVPRPSSDRRPQADSIEPRQSWFAKFGLEAIGPYVGRTMPTHWRCTTCDHTFVSTWKALRADEGAKCQACGKAWRSATGRYT